MSLRGAPAAGWPCLAARQTHRQTIFRLLLQRFGAMLGQMANDLHCGPGTVLGHKDCNCPMKILWPLLILVSSMLIAGCDSPTRLERTAARLTPGMTKTNVFRLFHDFKAHDLREFDHGLVMVQGVFFQTNVQRGTIVDFIDPKGHWPQPWEFCGVYFDTNSVIVGFCYGRDDGRPFGSPPRKE